MSSQKTNTNDKGSEDFSDYVICAFKMPVSSASTEVKTCKQPVKIHTFHRGHSRSCRSDNNYLFLSLTKIRWLKDDKDIFK